MRCIPLLLALLSPVATWAQAVEWPGAKSIVYIVPFTPGGTVDTIGRTLAQKLGESLHQTVVVENKPGQAGGIGAAYVARAAADGYTLLGGTISTHAINASIYKKLPYDPIKDFEPVTLVGRLPNVLVVNSQLGVGSVAELVALLKRDESKRNFASPGAGTTNHMAGQMFANAIGVKLTHVPYKGSVPAFNDVAAGQVSLLFDQVTAALPLVRSGKLKLLAVTTGQRIALLPELPTMIESGIADFEISSWQAVYAPKGTPEAIVQRLNAEIVKALRQPDVQARLSNQLAMEIVGSTPQELREHTAKEIPRWAELVKKSGAMAD
ncbi:Bug family tripartite tricarboxylate transporter substrate binding protein [Verminephrobacter eiseniae]|uniref:Uncharacterized protein UPF0065 n=1 Tax=Verminephrobacter eiseniae (strain EF01-2) TaxID=391735 RepID=A1WNC1_VEREI|nr:tripartite tricarboxylate transporter substrate binding protein [Verminephrobacter eiseniae]ABM59128.1 Uncharacterized protein UPF0065 [Verminephrobacter eiseniae EF01-2]MCW5284675.1 tripartite tricarboxylate transporter substrate binding protein [Verminephrobacter eiseniae]MCW5302382.1 tripartite tricarboxylate transporter substrate binding protein [Verminephrobacter eiseniae]MCW8181035.1 tripartite tricarboxylate transporter substrate binding protein [Verminephrobacter eiseniae]MCW8190322